MAIWNFGKNRKVLTVGNATFDLVKRVFNRYLSCGGFDKASEKDLMKECVTIIFFLYLPDIAKRSGFLAEDFQSVGAMVVERSRLSSSDLLDINKQYELYIRLSQRHGIKDVAFEIEQRLCNLSDNGSSCAWGIECPLSLDVTANYGIRITNQEILIMVLEELRS